MKKNDVFTFTAPNGVEVTGIVIEKLVLHTPKDPAVVIPSERCLCYNNGRLLICSRYNDVWDYDTILCNNYIPELDELLARYNDIEVARAETADGM